ncbi:MAG TPA: DUF6587 family protein [Rhizobacter sp.]|nr:DUF6587 family protein [Rhizobacter sp.]
MQHLLVALIVAGCAGYAVWVLMPSALRRTTARLALRAPWPQAVVARLNKAAQASTGCGCDGCDAKPAAPARAGATTHTIQIHRRPKSRP